VIGKSVRLGTRSATIVGVLEPSVPYPADTEIIANVVTSPHHLSATMVQGRVHRMTELFGRLAPGATVQSALAELKTAHANMMQQHPGDYSKKGDTRINAVLLRDQITSDARTVLLVLLAAAGLVFLIACSNVANLILARTVRREGELMVRQALGASNGALRRTLLAESLLLCGAGAGLGILIAQPMFSLLAGYAARFSVRALDLTVDSTMLWAGSLLALVAAVFLAFVPRLPSAGAPGRAGSARVSASTGRLRIFAVTQIAASFILLAGAAALLNALISLQSAQTGLDTRRVLAINVPVMSYGRTPDQVIGFYKEAMRRIGELPNVDQVAVGSQVPWRDAGSFGPGFEFSADGHVKAPGEQDPRGRLRAISSGFFSALGVPLIAGRDFNDLDRKGAEPVVIVSQSVAQRMFPNGDALNHHMMWTDPVMKFVGLSLAPRRIIGIAPDIDDENVVPGPALNVYQPFTQEGIFLARMFVHTHSDPYALVTPIRRVMRELSADQPVERAATLADVRAEVLAPNRLNTLVFGGFAAVALAIAVVGVAGVLAFSVSSRTREFGIRLAIGSEPRHLLQSVLTQGGVIAAAGIVAGAAAGYALARLAGSYLDTIRIPGPLVIIGSAAVLLCAALTASVLPALRAARVDVLQALRSE
jgi:predicted permease